jgi:hypothetical protein
VAGGSAGGMPSLSRVTFQERQQDRQEQQEQQSRDAEGFEGAEDAGDVDIDIDVSAVATDELGSRRARRGQLLADRLALWLERSLALLGDDLAALAVPEALAGWRPLKGFRRQPPPEFPSTEFAEFLTDALERD